MKYLPFGEASNTLELLELLEMSAPRFSIGKTEEMGLQGAIPITKGRNALTLFSAGGVYPVDQSSIEYPYWDTLTALAKIEFGFMGLGKSEVIGISLRDVS